MPKKLIRTKIVSRLLPHEVEVITDKNELNELFALKVLEELAEVQRSRCEDISEFSDLLEVVKAWAALNGFGANLLKNAKILKENRCGVFTNIALNNLNPDNPSNALYFQQDEAI